MDEIAAAFPDEPWLQKLDLLPPEGAEPAIWHGIYWDAWEALQFDRRYGAMGGRGPIPYAVISQYAGDHGISGENFRIFRHFLTAMDAEWLKLEADREKAAPA